MRFSFSIKLVASVRNVQEGQDRVVGDLLYCCIVTLLNMVKVQIKFL